MVVPESCQIIYSSPVFSLIYGLVFKANIFFLKMNYSRMAHDGASSESKFNINNIITKISSLDACKVDVGDSLRARLSDTRAFEYLFIFAYLKSVGWTACCYLFWLYQLIVSVDPASIAYHVTVFINKHSLNWSSLIVPFRQHFVDTNVDYLTRSDVVLTPKAISWLERVFSNGQWPHVNVCLLVSPFDSVKCVLLRKVNQEYISWSHVLKHTMDLDMLKKIQAARGIMLSKGGSIDIGNGCNSIVEVCSDMMCYKTVVNSLYHVESLIPRDVYLKHSVLEIKDIIVAALSYSFPEFGANCVFTPIDAITAYYHLINNEKPGPATYWQDFLRSNDLTYIPKKENFFFDHAYAKDFMGEQLQFNITGRSIISINHSLTNKIKDLRPMGYFAFTYILFQGIACVEAKPVDKAQSFLSYFFLLIIAMIPWQYIYNTLRKAATKMSKKRIDEVFEAVKQDVVEFFDVEPGFHGESLLLDTVSNVPILNSIFKGDDIFSQSIKSSRYYSIPVIKDIMEQLASKFMATHADMWSKIGTFLVQAQHEIWVRALFGSICMMCGLISAPSSVTHNRALIGFNYFAFIAPWVGLLIILGFNTVEICSSVAHLGFTGESWSSPEIFLDGCHSVLQNWKEYKKSPIGRSVSELISFVTAVPLMKLKPDGFSLEQFNIWRGDIDKIMQNHDCSMTGIMNSLVYVLQTAVHLVKTGNFVKDLRVLRTPKWVEAQQYIEQFNLGTYDPELTTPEEVESVYIIARDEIKQQLVHATGTHKLALETRLCAIRDAMHLLDRKEKMGTYKQQPYCIILYGGAGTGKTASANSVHHMIASASGMERLAILVKDERDQYDSAQTEEHNAVTIDDLGLDKIEFKKCSGAQLIRKYVATTYEYTVQAEVSKKGRVMQNVRQVVVTSNKIDAGIFKEVETPDALIRRVNIFVEIDVDDSVKKNRGTQRKPCPYLMSQLAEPGKAFQKYHKFQIYTLEDKCGKASRVNITDWIDRNTFVDYVTNDVKRHYQREEFALELFRNNSTLNKCEHGKWGKYCELCDGNMVGESATTATTANDSSFVVLSKLEHERPLFFLAFTLFHHFGVVFLVVLLAFCSGLIYWSGLLNIISEYAMSTVLCYICVFLIFFGCLWYQMNLLSCRFASAALTTVATYETLCEDVVKKSYKWLQYAETALAVMVVYKMARVVGPILNNYFYGEGLTTQALEFYEVRERKCITPGKEWVKPVIDVGEYAEDTKTMTEEQLIKVLEKNQVLCEFNFVTGGKAFKERTKGLLLTSSMILLSAHSVYSIFESLDTVDIQYRNGPNGQLNSRHLKVNKSDFWFTDDGNLCIYCKPFVVGDRKDIRKFFPLEPYNGEMVFSWINFDPNLVNQVFRVSGYMSSLDYRYHGTNYHCDVGYRFKTPMPTQAGNCGTYGVHYNNKRLSVIGMYIAGNGLNCEGYLATITQKQIESCVSYFESIGLEHIKPCVVKNIVSEIGDSKAVKADTIHKNNPVQYVSSFEPVVKDIFESHYTPRSCMVVTPIVSDVVELFGVEQKFQVPNMSFSRAVQPFLENAFESQDFNQNEAYDCALSDMRELMRQHCDLLKRELSSSDLDLLSKPFDEDVVLKGIDGNSLVTTLNVHTGAGFPYNKPKEKVCDLDDNNHLLINDDLRDELNLILTKLANGEHPGEVFTATLKDEPRKIGKNTRVFMASSLGSVIISKQWFDPMINSMVRHPSLTECALGINPYGNEWHEVWQHMYGFGSGMVFSDEDFKNYDQKLCIELRLVVSEMLKTFAIEMNWSQSNKKMLMKIVDGLYLQVLLNVNGVILHNTNFQPSGSTLTSRGNSIMNSFIQRYLWYLQNPTLKFSDYVRCVTLGDDVKLVMKEANCHLFSLERKIEDARKFGVTITLSDKVVDSVLLWKKLGSTGWFLKRFIYFNKDINSFVGVLDPISRLRSLYMCDKNSLKDPSFFCVVAENCLRESFLAGEEEYNYVKLRLHKLLMRNNLPVDYGCLRLTYAEYLKEFKESYQLVNRTCSPFWPIELVPDAKLSCFIGEGVTEKLENNQMVSVTFGKTTCNPELIYRMVGGEEVRNFLSLLKVFSQAGGYVNDANHFTVSQIYTINNTTGGPLLWDWIILAFSGIGGSVMMNFHVYGDGIVQVARGVDKYNTNFSDSNAGLEILDTRVNPNMTVGFPGPRNVRWFQIHGYQPVMSMPLKSINIFGLSPNDFETLPFVYTRIAIAEDGLLLGYRGPPILKFHNLDTSTFKGESETLGLTTFTEDKVDTEDELRETTVKDPTMIMADDQLSSMAWYTRCVPVQYLELPVGTDISRVFTPVFSFFTDVLVQQRIAGSLYFSGTAVLRIESPGGIAFSGRYIFSVISPNISADDEKYRSAPDVIAWMRMACSNHVVIDVGKAGYTDLIIPFVYDQNRAAFTDLFTNVPNFLLHHAFNPAVLMRTMSPLKTGSSTSSRSLFLNFSVYFKDLVLTGNTSTVFPAFVSYPSAESEFLGEGEGPNELPSSKASAIAGRLMSFGEIMHAMNMPMLAVPAEVGGIVFEGISGIARLFGHSRPIDARLNSAVPVTSTSMTSCDSDCHSRMLSLSNTYGTSMDGIIGGLGKRSECDFIDKWGMRVPLGLGQWTSDSVPFYIFASVMVSPVFINIDNSLVALSPQAHICSFFRYWCGTIEYEFDIVAPMGVTGIMEIMYEPYVPPDLTVAGAQLSSNIQSVRVDISTTRTVNVKVKWENNNIGLLTFGDHPITTFAGGRPPLGALPGTAVEYNDLLHNGLISCRVLVPISSSFTSTAESFSVDVIVWGRVVPEEIAVWDFAPVGLKGGAYDFDPHAQPNLLTNPVGNYELPNTYQDLLPQENLLQSDPIYLQRLPGGNSLQPGSVLPPTTTAHPTVPNVVTRQPTSKPSLVPVHVPTRIPTKQPSSAPLKAPTKQPTSKPIKVPSLAPVFPIAPVQPIVPVQPVVPTTPAQPPVQPVVINKPPTRVPSKTPVMSIAPTLNQPYGTIPPVLCLGTVVPDPGANFSTRIGGNTAMQIPYNCVYGQPGVIRLYFTQAVTTTLAGAIVDTGYYVGPNNSQIAVTRVTAPISDTTPGWKLRNISIYPVAGSTADAYLTQVEAPYAQPWQYILGNQQLKYISSSNLTSSSGVCANNSYTNSKGAAWQCVDVPTTKYLQKFAIVGAQPDSYYFGVVYEGSAYMFPDCLVGHGIFNSTGNLGIGNHGNVSATVLNVNAQTSGIMINNAPTFAPTGGILSIGAIIFPFPLKDIDNGTGQTISTPYLTDRVLGIT